MSPKLCCHDLGTSSGMSCNGAKNLDIVSSHHPYLKVLDLTRQLRTKGTIMAFHPRANRHPSCKCLLQYAIIGRVKTLEVFESENVTLVGPFFVFGKVHKITQTFCILCMFSSAAMICPCL